MGHLHIGSKETLYSANAFRHTDLKIAFRINNTQETFLMYKIPSPDKFSLSGIYKLMCPVCKMPYVEQNGRCFSTRYNKHKRTFHSNSHTSNLTKHHHEEAHSFGPIYNIMQVLHHHKKRAYLNITERFYIHIKHATGNHLNVDHTIFPNKIFHTLIKAK